MSVPRRIRRKAFAYITHGPRLLTLRHVDFPEAGLQVPAGSLEPGEAPDAGALREAREETGLDGLELVGFLGERLYDMAPYGRDELHQRYFYHLRCTATPPERWRHAERTPADGSAGPIAFEFFWAPLPDGVPPLIAGHDALVAQLAATMYPTNR